ncbi:hypothetical protein [Methanolobus sp. WCC5]|uniref:hypothetical protein n=1 Tax=Methanolobus sp. WCC5 TaxID=3125785 RepID=UPI00324C297B
MRNIQKCVKTYTNNGTDICLLSVVNGKYKRSMDKEDLELMRFMIGGMEAK